MIVENTRLEALPRFRLQVDADPEVPAIDEGDRVVTYGELASRVDELVPLLKAAAERRPVVATIGRRPSEVITALLSTLEVGGVFVPFDPSFPVARIERMVRQVAPDAIVADAEKGAEARSLPGTTRDEIECGRLLVRRLVPETRTVPTEQEDICAIFFTSGSTGRPKGILASLRGIEHFLQWEVGLLGLGGGIRVAQLASPAFDPFMREALVPLISGGTVCGPPLEDGQLDLGRLGEWLDERRVQLLHCVPSVLRALLSQDPSADRFRELRFVLLAGEVVQPTDVERWTGIFGDRIELYNLYGPTETTLTKFWYRIDPRDGARSTVPIGRPMPGARAVVVGDDGRPCPPGAVGEIYIRTPYRSWGYLDDPEREADCFVPNPFGSDPDDLIYKTGDRGRMRPDGTFEFVGREDQQAQIRGARVELGEVEQTLLGADGVQAAAAATYEEPDIGTSLCAYVVASGDGLGAEALQEHCTRELPSYMLPSRYVLLDDLPRTPNGKLDRKRLPRPRDLTGAGERPIEPPANDLEREIAEIWADVLGVESAGVSVRERFFLAGGNSLTAVLLLARISSKLGVRLSPSEIFEHSTVAELAGRVAELREGDESDDGGLEPIRRIPRDGDLPLSFAQERLWFFGRLAPDGSIYNMPAALHVGGRLDVLDLEQCLDEIVRRHEILRTRFVERDGQPVQVIDPPRRFPAPVVDLTGLPESEVESETDRLLSEEARRPFSLEEELAWRSRVVRRAPRDHAILFTLHHIAGDAWSRRVLSREISRLYDAFSRGLPSPLEELPLQYADYAAWQRRHLDADRMEDQLDYWRGRLAGAPPATDLRTDFPRSERLTFRGGVERRELPKESVERLRALSNESEVTPFMLLLAAFFATLSRASDQRDLVVGIDTANRPRGELEGLIGFFINQLAIRVRLEGNPTFREHLARVRETVLGAFAHQDVPFQRVVAEAGGRREPGRTPLFQVLFTLAQPDDDDGVRARDLEIRPLGGMADRARFDLTLYMIDRGERLDAVMSYNRDLFRPRTIRRMLDDLERLVSVVVDEPDTRMDAWDHRLSASEEDRAMEQKKPSPARFASFKEIQPKAVSVSEESLVTTDTLAPDQPLPLVVRPGTADVDLAEWAPDHREWIEEKLVEHGAILFRGFDIRSPEALEAFASKITSGLYRENAEHPRDSVSGNVYTPTFYPSEQKLLWHNENSFNHEWPLKIFFCCQTPPDKGGETPLVDSREVYRRIDEDVRRRFEERQIRYQRNYGDGLGLGWETVFQTEDREEVEERCRQNRMSWEWKPEGRLRTLGVRPAVIRHPRTDEPCWFNQAQHWHTACLDPATRESVTSMFDPEDLPRACTYGDGSPISDEEMKAILDIYEDLEVAFPWNRGDVVLVDNVLIAHARNPFEGPRKLLVAMGEMKSYDDV
jgi:amino acid adenylation domain-containing protein